MNEYKFKIAAFNELSLEELYKILFLRNEVFIVEQNCVYQDIDNKDSKAIHIMLFKNEALVAYARVFKPGDYFKEASIGRVVVSKSKRNLNLGKKLMKKAISYINKDLLLFKIEISAQLYLKKFYESLGFVSIGEEYLEDDIPHIKMIKG